MRKGLASTSCQFAHPSRWRGRQVSAASARGSARRDPNRSTQIPMLIKRSLLLHQSERLFDRRGKRDLVPPCCEDAPNHVPQLRLAEPVNPGETGRLKNYCAAVTSVG
jgi:hypothetical protein